MTVKDNEQGSSFCKETEFELKQCINMIENHKNYTVIAFNR